MKGETARRTVEGVWRSESAGVVAALVRITRDVGLAEDLAQDALVAALVQWPDAGVPRNPGAWLMAVAKRRAIDGFRRGERRDAAYAAVAVREGANVVDDIAAAVDHVEDDVLRLMFLCCHPALGEDARLSLTLRLVAGLTTAQIARSCLASESTVAARITRAKKTLSRVDAVVEELADDERRERLAAVLAVVYLLFNEGYAASSGDDWVRVDLCAEAVRLGRLLATLVPDESEVMALVALMELQHSRAAARVDAGGAPVLLLDQERSRWDHRLVRQGLASLDRSAALAASPGSAGAGVYLLQAEIAACHSRARTADQTDWPRIASLYAVLTVVTGSPVVELNRAVAVSFAEGPQAALALLDAADLTALGGYHLLPSVRGDLLARLGRPDEARAELLRAATMTSNAQERHILSRRAAAL